MRVATTLLAATLLAAAAGAGTDNARLLEPETAKLDDGEGALLFVLQLPESWHHAVVRSDRMVITLLRLEDKARIRLDAPEKTKLVALPAGHYTIKELYNLDRSLDVQNVTKGKEQAFEVVAGKFNYAGAWTIKPRSNESMNRVDVDVKFEPSPLQEMAGRFQAFVAGHPISLSPAGKPAQALGAK